MIRIFQNLYLYYYELTQSHIPALLLLSLSTAVLMALLNRIFRVYPQREANTQKLLAPQIRDIKARFSAAMAQHKIRELYRRYRYHPIYALRSALPLFFQLPFLFAAYHALSGLPALSGVRFGIIADLSQPDAMILGYNVLPFLMTGINLLTAFLNPAFRLKEKFQAIFIALFFLALLYKAPAALLIYWTTNNFILLLRVLAQRLFAKGSVADSEPGDIPLKQRIPDFPRQVLMPFLLLIFLANFLQFIADGEGIFFYRFSKTVPLLAAAIGFYYLVLSQSSFPCKKLARIIGTLPPVLLIIAHFGGIYLIPANRYVIFAYLTGLYLGFSLLLSLYQLLKGGGKSSAKSPAKASFDFRKILLYILSLLIPSLHLASANPGYLSEWFYPLFLLLPFVIFALARITLMYPALFTASFTADKGFSSKRQDEAATPCPERDSGLMSLYSLAFAMLFCFLPVVRAMMQKNSAHDGDFWLILAVAITLIYLYRIQLNRQRKDSLDSLSSQKSPGFRRSGGSLKLYSVGINIILSVLFLTACTNFITSLVKGEKPSQRSLQELSEELSGLQLKDKANIYLFVYDGLPNPRVFREQNLPYQPLQDLFAKYGYKVYEDTYTIGNESLNSMAMTLNISAEQYKSMSKMQDIYSGNSVANLMLTGAGYGSYNLLENYFTGTYAISNQDLVTEYFPPKELTAVQSDFFLTLLRGVLQGEFRFDTKGIMVADRYTEADRQNRKHELIRDGVRPKFVIDQVSKPSHSQNSGKCLPNETELWIGRYMEALQYLERDLEALHQHDPEAIAIFIGDHGPALLGDCYVLQNWKREEISPELIWDRIGTMVAVRWPDPARAAKYDQNLTLNQDLFPVIFSYLADDPAPLELMPDRTFSGYELLTRPAVRFRSGRMVNDEW